MALGVVWELAVALLTGLSVCAANVPACPQGHYLSREHAECRRCDACPPNNIIGRPCAEDSNTVCRPFFEFHQFHQAPRPSVDLHDLPLPHDNDGGDDDSVDWPDGEDPDSRFFDYLSDLDEDTSSNSHNNNNREKQGKGQQRHSQRKGKAGGAGQQAGDHSVQESGHGECGGGGGERGGVGPSVHNTEACDSHWKVTSLCLIGVLGILCLFLVAFFVFMICHLRNRRGYLKKVLYSSDMDPTGRAVAVPNSYIPVLTSTGCDAQQTGATPSRVMLDTAYMYSDDCDGEHSGQTVSTTKSSDYVYFKSPQSGKFCEV